MFLDFYKKYSILHFYFFIYAFLGWCLETGYAIVTLGYFVKRGFLFGPICPIYGYASLILILFFSNYRKKNFKLFIYSSVIFSVFEYFVSYLLDVFLKLKCWDYTYDSFNLNGRISIFYSLVWGIIAILFINKFHPFIKRNVAKILFKIPIKLKYSLMSIFILFFSADTIVSIIKYIKLF